MARTAKIAVSVDRALLDDLERVREKTGESRSAAVGRAIRLLTRAEEQRQKVEEYVEAYRKQPETKEEIAGARAMAKRTLRALPWEDE